MTATPEYVRRSEFVIAYWRKEELMLENYATGVSHSCEPAVLDILHLVRKWTPVGDLVDALPHWDPPAVLAKVAELVEHTVLKSGDRPVDPKERALSRWVGWNPAAGFYHLATKDVRYSDPDEALDHVVTLQWHPEALKSYPSADRIELPAFPRDGPFPEVLLQRRTWRHFGERRVTLDELSTLLGLTWAVQKWAHTDSDRLVPLKTYPSGGARHSMEAYVLVCDVEGIRSGTYHYCPDTHALSLLVADTPESVLEEFLPQQCWFHRPAAVVFMTSVFERVYSKYRHPRAYRVVLLEAGHIGQNFCLLATWLGLAPFCTAALGDSAIEEHLGIDGVDESVIYAVGVGSRPAGLDWAPDYRSLEAPAVSPPQYAVRSEVNRKEAD